MCYETGVKCSFFAKIIIAGGQLKVAQMLKKNKNNYFIDIAAISLKKTQLESKGPDTQGKSTNGTGANHCFLL